MNIKKKPLVSVVMITYGHENFIAQAISGVLMQECDFEVELILANDCSPDTTDEVIREIIKNHPKASWINYLRHNKNIGAMSNFIFALNEAQGKYIALCEGDDYWTDPLKLQKQVDFLEANEDYSASASQSLVIYNNNDKSHPFNKEIRTKFTLNDLYESRPFHTASVVFRSILPVNKMPVNITSGDRFLYLIIGSFGKVHFLNEITCVYRKSPIGVSHKISSKKMKLDLNMVALIQTINPSIDNIRLKKYINKSIINYSTITHLDDFIISYLLIVYYNFYSPVKNIKEILKLLLFFVPKIIKVVLRKPVGV